MFVCLFVFIGLRWRVTFWTVVVSFFVSSFIQHGDNMPTTVLFPSSDYDFQTAMVEAFCRINTSDQRKQLAHQWFSTGPVSKAFIKIKNSEFETVMFFFSWIQVYHSHISFILTTLDLHDSSCNLFNFNSFIIGLSRVFKHCKWDAWWQKEVGQQNILFLENIVNWVI